MIAGEATLRVMRLNETPLRYDEAMLQRAAQRVRDYRRAHGEMTQKQFAALAGVSVGCVQGFETGKRKTRTPKLLKIALAIGTTLDDLVREDAPVHQVNPLYADLTPEDVRIAHAYHHAGAELKHAIKRLIIGRLPDERRERIATVIARFIHADDPEFSDLEVLITGYAARTPAPAAPVVTTEPLRKRGKS